MILCGGFLRAEEMSVRESRSMLARLRRTSQPKAGNNRILEPGGPVRDVTCVLRQATQVKDSLRR
jgi:hypothetical protein